MPNNITAFVHIIESPSPKDLLEERTEGRALSKMLKAAAIPHEHSLTIDRATFEEALSDRLMEAWKRHGCIPILHLSMHGNADGVQLGTGEFVTWHDLRQLLLPLVRQMQGSLLLCLSSCYGVSACRMAMYTDAEPHFWALVSHCGAVSWRDATFAFSSFYHLFFKGFDLNTCVDSMKVASGNHEFQCLMGAASKATWEEHVRKAPTIAELGNALYTPPTSTSTQH
jgi:hypothetical protein